MKASKTGNIYIYRIIYIGIYFYKLQKLYSFIVLYSQFHISLGYSLGYGDLHFAILLVVIIIHELGFHINHSIHYIRFTM